MIDKQGQNAYLNGKWLENQVEKTINHLGVCSAKYKDIEDSFVPSRREFGMLVKNAPYINMFGKNARGEFLLHLNEERSKRIECRYQEKAGTVEDKLPKLLGDCLCMEEDEVLIVIEGAGMSSKAKTWLRNEANAVTHKTIKVLSLGEFEEWAYDTIGPHLCDCASSMDLSI